MKLLALIVVPPLFYFYPKEVSIITISVVSFYNFYWKRRNLPSGPTPLPLIGNVTAFFPRDKIMDKLINYNKTYGPIHTFWAGEKPLIFVTDYELMVKYFVKQGEHFAERMVNKDLLKAFRGGEYGIAPISGERWREQRRFALHTLRDFGMGKNQMEQRILTEVETLLEKIDKTLESSNDEVDIAGYTDVSVGSLINAIICGYRFTIGDREEEFHVQKERTKKIVSNIMNPLVDMALKNPWMMKVWPLNVPAIRTFANFKLVMDFIEDKINKHVEECDYNEDFEPRDFMDVFLLEKARKERNGEDTSDRSSLMELRGMCLDLWMAGQETTSSALSWVFAYLINNQDVQKKVHAELDEKVGDRLAVSSDKHELHYLNAVVMEALRCAKLLPLNIPHATNAEVNLEGYILPAGSVVVPQISVLVTNDKFFPDPFAFKPERFIDESGHFKNIDQFIPFSLGKRQCPGEGMARAEMFLFAANILNKYRLQPGKVPPTLKKISPMSPTHAHFTAIVESRI